MDRFTSIPPRAYGRLARQTCACVLLMAVAGGCASKGGAAIHNDQADLDSVEPVDYWRIVPVRMRIYPSTRFIREGENVILEARMELFDDMDDSVKASGLWHFELAAGDGHRGGAIAQRLYAWDVPMMLIDQQRFYYDRITRAYLFRLKLDNAGAARRITTLYATFVLPDGTRLEAEQVLNPEEIHMVPPQPAR